MSSQRERFCQLIAFFAMTSSEAYREAYDVKEPDAQWVGVEASRLRNDPEVALRIENLMRPAILRQERSKDAHVANLRALRDLAARSGQMSAAIQAETNVGKVDGFYVDRSLTKEAGSLEELVTGGTSAEETGTSRRTSAASVADTKKPRPVKRRGSRVRKAE